MILRGQLPGKAVPVLTYIALVHCNGWQASLELLYYIAGCLLETFTRVHHPSPPVCQELTFTAKGHLCNDHPVPNNTALLFIQQFCSFLISGSIQFPWPLIDMHIARTTSARSPGQGRSAQQQQQCKHSNLGPTATLFTTASVASVYATTGHRGMGYGVLEACSYTSEGAPQQNLRKRQWNESPIAAQIPGAAQEL